MLTRATMSRMMYSMSGGRLHAGVRGTAGMSHSIRTQLGCPVRRTFARDIC